MTHLRRFRLLLASATVLAFSGPAFALDGADLLKKLNAAYATSGATINTTGVTVEGTTVTLTGASLKASGKPEEIKIGDITMEGVEEQDGGGYYAETVSLPDIDYKDQEGEISVKDIAISGLTIPGNPAGGTIDDVMLYDSAGTGPINVMIKGKQVFSLEETTTNLSRQENDAGFDFDASLNGIKADLSQVEDAKAKDAIQKLGLSLLEGKIAMGGSWVLAGGNFALTDFGFDFNNVGSLNLAFDISGYTMEFVKAMQEALAASEANPNKEEANQALGLSAMGLLQQLTFNTAEIRFEDATITKRVLDYVGAQQGIPGDQLAQSLKGLIPIMMAQLNIPELQNQVSAAANAYLDDPKSLTISAEPENPVPFPMILGAAMGAPNTIPSVLGVTVTAND